jgi:hypothetical protein
VDEHARVMAALGELQAPAAAPAAANGPAADPQQLAALVETLDQRLSGSDAAAVDALEAVKGALGGSHPTFVQEMERLIVTYNFEQARVHLARFAATLRTGAARASG